MLKCFSYEMKCAMFAGSIFVIFFTSSIISVARGETISYREGYNTPVDYNVEPDPPPPLEPTPLSEQVPTEPDIGGPAQSDSPQIGDPNPIWATRINIWFQSLSNFYDSILSALGF